ncbi:hypothetical protein KC315_g2329 [Hortaea werneckii]|nr:hypothetical protein KC315_g2329 [Hortaea werneckii]
MFRESTTRPGNVQACVTQFVHHIGQLLERKAHEDSNQLEVYPFAFVVFDHDDPSSQVTVMVALKGEDDQLSLESCGIPLEVQLGQELDSLRMGDISTQDLVSSTGLPNALSLPAWIDAKTDSVLPTKASVDLIGNPKDSRYQMKWEYVKALFPIACRDTKKADGIKMHRRIFICCDNDDPHNKGLLLINVDWDENVDRSNEELEAVGEQLEHTETRVQLSECLQKARDMASA